MERVSGNGLGRRAAAAMYGAGEWRWQWIRRLGNGGTTAVRLSGDDNYDEPRAAAASMTARDNQDERTRVT